MKESIRIFKNNDELIKELEEERKLVFPDSDSKKIFKDYLIQYGYFSCVKKILNPLMFDDIEKKIFKKEFTSNNLRYVFDIDRNISVIIFKYFRNIEFLLNSALLKTIAKRLNKAVKCPYLAALDSISFGEIFKNIDENIQDFKKKGGNSNVKILFNDLYKNFNNDDFDCRSAINENKKNECQEIKDIINKGWFKEIINSEAKKSATTFSIIKNIVNKGWEYLDIFSLFQILNFSQLKRIFSFLSTSLQNEVINEFFNYYIPSNKKAKLKNESFEVILNIFTDLRNILMHNGSIIKFSNEVNDDITKKLNDYFNIKIIDESIKLCHVISIMESIINIKNAMFNEINDSIKIKIEKRTKRNDSVSNLVLEIIEDETGIKLKK